MRKHESIECPAGSGAVGERLFTPYSDCQECKTMFPESELQKHEGTGEEYCPTCFEKVDKECKEYEFNNQ